MYDGFLGGERDGCKIRLYIISKKKKIMRPIRHFTESDPYTARLEIQNGRKAL